MIRFPLHVCLETLDIESSNNIFFLYHTMGLVLGHFHKNLLLIYMYTKSSIQSNINLIYTLLWTNEYEFQFCLHNDVKHTCAKMRRAMGVNVLPPTLIKPHHSCEGKSRSFTRGCLKNDLDF